MKITLSDNETNNIKAASSNELKSPQTSVSATRNLGTSVSTNKIDSKPLSHKAFSFLKKPKVEDKKGLIQPKPAKKGNGKARKVVFIVIALFLTVLAGLGYFGYQRIVTMFKNIGIEITPGTVIGTIKPEKYDLKKDSSGNKTNVLLVGIDTRETEKTLINTDTIIIASYDYKANEIVMLSIPRDTYVNYPLDTKYSSKINAVYGYGEQDGDGMGLKALKGVVEAYTGLEIQYYGMIDLQGFKKGVDVLGGITVNVENSFIDYAYPADPGSSSEYQTVKFEEGVQQMDGSTALKFARSRKSQQNYEGSDYARAKRQQKVITAVKDKVFSSDTWLDANKILELMTTLEENIKISEVTLQDIKAGIGMADLLKDAQVYSFVFDPTIGGGEVIFEDRATWYVYPVAGVGNYTQTTDLTKALTDNPKLYSENATVFIYDAGFGYYPTYNKVLELSKKYPYLKFYFQGTLYRDKVGNYIFENSTEKYPSSMNFYSEAFGITDAANKIKPEFVSSRLNGEDIVILIGAEPEPVVETQPEVTE